MPPLRIAAAICHLVLPARLERSKTASSLAPMGEGGAKDTGGGGDDEGGQAARPWLAGTPTLVLISGNGPISEA